MNKLISVICIVMFGICQAGAQTKSGLIGRKIYVGWEHSIRPFGKMSARLTNLDIGLGKLKIEKLINRNRTLGFSYEKKDYLIKDDNQNYYGPFISTKQRYLVSRNYSILLKKYSRRTGIAPIGNYIGLSLTLYKNSIDLNRKAQNKITFGDLYGGFELGRSFPLAGTRLMGNISAGIFISGHAFIQIMLLDEYGSYSNSNLLSSSQLNWALFGMNVIKANVGVSYALF